MYRLIKTLIIILLVLLSHVHFAQTQQKGKVNLTLSGIPLVDFNNGYYGFAIKPGLEFHISDHISIQNDFFFLRQKGNYFDEGDVISKTFGFSPSLRYNQSFSKNKWNFFGQVGIGFGSVLYQPVEESEYNLDRYNSGVLLLSGGIGFGYRISDVFELEMVIPYIYAQNITNPYNADILFSGFGPMVGIKFCLNKNR